MDRIIPHFWYDTAANDAARRYTDAFSNPSVGLGTDGTRILSRVSIADTPSGTADLVTIQLAGQRFMLITAGPLFHFTPAISFRVDCASQEETTHLWTQLSQDGETMMPLGEYPFSDCYGWTEDRYGLSWQIMHVADRPVGQKITPTLMFSGAVHGRAEEAVQFYTGIFPESEIGFIDRYRDGEAPDVPGTIRHIAFRLGGMAFAAMDSARVEDAPFNEAISLVVPCRDQAEIDYFWNHLTFVPEAEQCGWLKDRFGISWQIVPAALDEMLLTADPEQKRRLTESFLAMKRLDIAELERAFAG